MNDYGLSVCIVGYFQALYVVSCAHVEQQYQRFIDDLTTALIAEKQLILNSLDEARQRICRQTESHNRDNERCSRLLSELSSACQRVGDESTAVGILSHAAELQPLVIHMKRHRREYAALFYVMFSHLFISFMDFFILRAYSVKFVREAVVMLTSKFCRKTK